MLTMEENDLWKMTKSEPSLWKTARFYLAFIKERLKAETFDKFKDFIVKSAQEAETGDRAMMFSEVNALLTGQDDLIEKFKYFLYYSDHNSVSSDRSTSVESKGEDKAHRSSLDKKSLQKVVNTSVDFIKKVKRTLKDENFKSFLKIIIGFQQHKDIKRVEREGFDLFREHPELEIEFSEFLAEANAGRTVQDMVASKKRKREEAQAHCERRKLKMLSGYEFKLAVREDDLYERDLSYNSMLCAKVAAERLIMENSGRNLRKKICVGNYFSDLNLKCLKEVMKCSRRRNKFLCDKLVRREKAISESKRIVSRLEKKIDILTMDWSEVKKRMAIVNREEELQIPVFDWRE